MATYAKRKLNYARDLIKRRQAIALNQANQTSWLQELLAMKTGRDSRQVVETIDYDYSYLKLDPDFSSIHSSQWQYWRDLYNRHTNNSTPLRQMTQQQLSATVPRTLENAYVREANAHESGNKTRISTLINRQLQGLNNSQLSPQEIQAQTAVLNQQQECLTASTVPPPPGSGQTGKVSNPVHLFFAALSDPYLFNSRCNIDYQDPFWITRNASADGRVTIGPDYGSNNFTAATGLPIDQTQPSKRLQLCFVTNDSNTFFISRIYLVERLLLANFHLGGQAAPNPWVRLPQHDGLRQICNYSYTYGLLCYFHLNWSRSLFNFV